MYKPNPIDTSAIELPKELLELTEKIAENVHENWSVGRIADGWIYGEERDDTADDLCADIRSALFDFEQLFHKNPPFSFFGKFNIIIPKKVYKCHCRNDVNMRKNAVEM